MELTLSSDASSSLPREETLDGQGVESLRKRTVWASCRLDVDFWLCGWLLLSSLVALVDKGRCAKTGTLLETFCQCV